jgi:DNA (cytosine-5)-methyltransferase 1
VSTYGVKLLRSDDIALLPHPLACAEDTFNQWCADRLAKGARLAVDLFSGAGGLSLGLEQAGWTVAIAVDNEPKAVQTHRHNFPGLALNIDLSVAEDRNGLVQLANSTEIDLVSGGPPCQPFSRAGRSKIRSLVESGIRAGEDGRRELWRSFLDTALEISPRAIMMENVPDMGLGDDFRVVRTMIDRLEHEGYRTDLRLADAWRYGVPQHRQRLILLARKDSSSFTWPCPNDSQTTLRDSIGDLPRLGMSTGNREMRYKPRASSGSFIKEMRSGAPADVVWDHMTRPVRDDDREIFALMSPTTLYSEIPENLRRYKADTFDDKYNRLGWSELSRSITAHIARDGYWYIHPEELRTLTVREAARLQTFPDRFRFAGTRSDAFRQIGNAVPPLLGSAAARAVAPMGETYVSPAGDTRGVVEIRDILTEWGRNRRRGNSWYAVPGPSMTVAVAAMAATLTSGPVQPGAIAALKGIRGLTRLGVGDIIGVQRQVTDVARKKVAERFGPLARKIKVWSDVNELARELHLSAAEDRYFRVMCGQDVMLRSAASARTTARALGTESDRINRGTQGRLDLARLIGAGDEAPLRMAVLHHLGRTVCTAKEPDCLSCPLMRLCASQGHRAGTPSTEDVPM